MKLNDSKSQILLVGTPTNVNKCKLISSSIQLGSETVSFSPSVKNLGVIFDENLSFLDHILNCRKSAFFTLKNLSRIRNHFDQKSFECLIHAFISSKLDYCNSLFINLPSSSINLLQSIQNFAARLILRKGRYCHITPLLKQLHWLPVSDRIFFKLMLITYKVINTTEPSYLYSLIPSHVSSRPTRSSDNPNLEIHISHSVRMGDRAFSIAAPTLWNSLPNFIRQAPSTNIFKTRLKTYLFSNRYS